MRGAGCRGSQAIPPAIALAVAGALLAIACDGGEPGPELAPGFDLESLAGERVALADFAGQVVVIDFWATWCAPCLVQIPILNAFAAEDRAAVQVLGVAVDAEGREVVAPFAESTPIDYTVLLGDEALARAYGAPGFPALAVVDPTGRIDSLHVGVISPSALDEAVRSATR